MARPEPAPAGAVAIDREAASHLCPVHDRMRDSAAAFAPDPESESGGSDADDASTADPGQQRWQSGPKNASRPSRSIRSSLLRIVFILIVPAVSGLAALASGSYYSEREQMSQHIFSTAGALTSALDGEFAGTIAAAQVLANSPLLTSAHFAALHREALRVLPLLHGSAVVLMDADGQPLIDTSHPYGTPLGPAPDPSNLRKVLETGQPAVSDLFIAGPANEPALAVSIPVSSPDRPVKYILDVILPLSHLDELLQRQQLPDGWAATFVDTANVIVAHSRNPARVGRTAPLNTPAIRPAQGLLETKRPDGTPIYVGFGRSGISGFTVAISVPTAQFVRQPSGILVYGGIGVFLIMAAGLLLVMLESARISGAVQRLIAPALAVGRGDTPVIVSSNVRETDEVAEALGRAHGLVERRTLERDHAQLSVERRLGDELFRLAVEACPSGMVMSDGDGRIVMLNTEIENLFGYKREELIGRHVDALVPERLQAHHVINRTRFMATPECRHMGAGRTLFGRRKDGTEFPVEVGLNPIHTGQEQMVLSAIIDITQRRRTERLKDEFVATVSHELRTPLTSIAGSLGLLAGQWAAKLPDSAARLLTIAHTNSQRLVRLVNDILDIEKIEAGHIVFDMRRIALRKLLENTIEDNRGFAASYGVQLRLDETAGEFEVNADSDRLAQVITNLLSNATKFSAAGEEVVVGVARNAANARITVRDRGPGIPEDFKPHIFEKFAQADATNTRKKGGTGLGLSIVKEIVDRLGGQVGFDDAPGGGTIFRIDLPLCDGTAGGEVDLIADAPLARILLCDDDRKVAEALRTLLHREGFVLDFAHTVTTALARADAARYGAIIVDLQLPDGYGVDLIARLRAQPRNRDTPIIVMSGDPEQGQSDIRSSRLNVQHWLGKPIRPKTLVATLKAVTASEARQHPRLLHVDDDRDMRTLVANELRPIIDVVSADSAEMALRIVASERIDLVVLDVGLGQDSGLDLLPELRDSRGKLIPVIIFSNLAVDTGSDDQISSALTKMNSSLDSLAAAVRDRLALAPKQPAEEIA
ncbi:MAG TPA: response regulator [Bradyrhizobium sp.]|nr:response regulator [Bradyrhizobium sp.]